MENIEEKKSQAKPERFVDWVISELAKEKPNTALRAALRRADSSSWEYLTHFCDLENKKQARAFALIGASLAYTRPVTNGALSLGTALARCYDTEEAGGDKRDAARQKMNRLLSCTTVQEVITMLRPILRLINSKDIRLDYICLLKELVFYPDEQFHNRIKPRWAKDFYYRKEEV
jgi:CRISPR system Cascade subunit CasB